MANENMVTIPLEEYIELRRRSEENFYLTDRMGKFEQRQVDFENKLWELERRIENGK